LELFDRLAIGTVFAGRTPHMPVVLVTGGSGFVGGHCIIKLLNSGYSVRATVRSPSRESEILAILQAGGISCYDALSFANADLTNDEGWPAAIAGCDYVLHVASPLASSGGRDDLIAAACGGTLRVLRFSRDLGVKRVVVTSSFGAVGYGPIPDRLFTEDDWTDPDGPIQPYIRSKTLAERAAWEFFRTEAGALELTVLNPVGIFGPALSVGTTSSLKIFEGLLNGTIFGSSTINFGIVDVRDVADIQVKALTNPEANGQRFILTAGRSKSLAHIAQLLKDKLGERAKKINIQEMPVKGDIGLARDASNEKAVRIFGWSPTPEITTIIDTAESLFALGKVPV
jgi:dihydroflavonol-4-reductase